MSIFNLPDLGEGLPEGEIHEWFVHEGDIVTADQPMVAMETAKAIVDVPCPQSGKVIKLYGKPGDIIKTGQALIEFAAEQTQRKDSGTVVGYLEESNVLSDDHFIMSSDNKMQRPKATPNIRQLAKKLNVDLNTIHGSGEHGLITQDDVTHEAEKQTQTPVGYESLVGVRRSMMSSMVKAHQQVVPASIFDEVDIESWTEPFDISVRLIRAIQLGCTKEPALNAWFDSDHAARQCFNEVHLGLAMDNDEGLFVPVIRNTASLSDIELRQQINEYKHAVHARTISAAQLTGATFILSNFGKFAGRFATPQVLPPMVAILAVGRLYQGIVSCNGSPQSHRLLPLSLTFDHRAVTGGEATRFLGVVMESLSHPL